MSQNIYECMIIFDSNWYAKDPGGVGTQVNKMIEGLGGDVRASRLWNEQKLAYPIKGHRKGAYWLAYFRLDPTKLVELNRACRLNDHILRHMVLKIDPRLEETLVSHALGIAPAAEGAVKEEAPVESGEPVDSGEEVKIEEVAVEEEAAVVGDE